MSVQNFKLDKQADPLLTEGWRPVFSESGGVSLDICHVLYILCLVIFYY